MFLYLFYFFFNCFEKNTHDYIVEYTVSTTRENGWRRELREMPPRRPIPSLTETCSRRGWACYCAVWARNEEGITQRTAVRSASSGRLGDSDSIHEQRPVSGDYSSAGSLSGSR
jgi:hypothetical protein